MLACTAILNSDDPETSRWAAHGCPGWFGQTQRPGLGAYSLNGRAQILLRHGCGETEISLEEVRQLPGEHNLRNMLAAGAAAIAAGIDPGLLTEGMKSFAPLPHRLEFVGEYRGRRFYNDSISTTPESTVAALHSFDAPIVLLAGGYDKQVDLRPMADAIRARAKAAALMGQTADWLEHLIESEPGRTPPHAVLDDFASAFRWAVDHSAPGDVVVLSPGCASYDWFTNFEERGRRFVELVTDWGTDADA